MPASSLDQHKITLKLNSIKLPFCTFVLILVVFKLAVLVSLPGVLVNNLEWLEKGNLARDLTEGLIMPIQNYQTYNYQGSHLFIGFIAAPFFYLFGKTSFSFHLVGILFSVATFICWYYFFEKYFNKRTKYIMSFLYILAPPLFTRYTVCTTSNHNEVNLFIILFTIQFFNVLFMDKKENRIMPYILLGLIGCIGVWFWYSTGIAVLVCMIFWFVFNRQIYLRNQFWIFLGILLVGMYPLLSDVFLRQNIISDLFVYKEWYAGYVKPSFGTRLTSVFFEHIPRSFGFQSYMISIFYYFVALASFLWLIYEKRRVVLEAVRTKCSSNFRDNDEKSIVTLYCMVFLSVYMLIYFLSNYSYEQIFTHPHESIFRYFVPLFPFMFGIIAISGNHLLNNKRKIVRWGGFVSVAILLMSGILSNFSYITFKNIDMIMHSPGISNEFLGSTMYRNLNQNRESTIRALANVDDKYKEGVYVGYGHGRGADCEDCILGEKINEYKYFLSTVNEQYKEHVIRGIILGVLTEYYLPRSFYYGELTQKMALNKYLEHSEYFMESIQIFTNERKKKIFFGLGFEVGGLIKDFDHKHFERIGAEYLHDFYQGVGMAIQSEYDNDQIRINELLESVNANYRTDIDNGINLYKLYLSSLS